MAIPGYMWLVDNQGQAIHGTVKIKQRENSVEVLTCQHRIHLPTDDDTGSAMSTRKHEPFTILKTLCSTSPILYKACCDGKTLQQVKLQWYKIDTNGAERPYFQQTLLQAKVVSIGPKIPNTKEKLSEKLGHLEEVQFRYETIRWAYLDGNIMAQDTWLEKT